MRRADPWSKWSSSPVALHPKLHNGAFIKSPAISLAYPVKYWHYY
jgi:hypothetical protein